jgi:hypothetical protein
MCWIAVSSSHDRRFVVLLGSAATSPREAPDAPEENRREISHALRLAVSRAAALGGSVEAAAMYTDWREPVVVASPPGGRSRWMRMWSMSKVVAMVGLLRAEGWGRARGNALSPEVVSALQGAITRSENCRQRRVVLELQQATGGPGGARRAVAEVLRAAGGRARPSDEVEPPDPSCIEYLEGQDEIADPLATGALLGTSEWRIGDAIRFVRALGAGVYGEAITKRVLDEMRIPKAVSREVAPSELTAPLDWGAGRAFAGLRPAYKAGWGGSLNGDFLAGQIALVDLPAGRLAVAAVFHPDVQPPSDDPGRTAAPHAIELVMKSLRRAQR